MTRNEVYRQLSTSGEVLLFIYVIHFNNFVFTNLKFQQEFLEKGVNLDKLRRSVKRLVEIGILEKGSAPSQYQLTEVGKNLTPSPIPSN